MSSRCPKERQRSTPLWLPSPLEGRGPNSDSGAVAGPSGGAKRRKGGVCVNGITFAVSLTLTACAGTTPLACAPGTSPMTKYELFLGQNIGATGRVSDVEWRRFLTEEVTPRYPDGFTVLDAAGQWRDPMGTIISEQSRNLVVIVRDPASELPKITAIRDTYKTRFRQDAVLFVQSQICAGF